MLLCGCMKFILDIASNIMKAFLYLKLSFLYLLAAIPNTEISFFFIEEKNSLF